MDIQDYLRSSVSPAISTFDTIFNSHRTMAESLLEQHERMQRLTMGIQNVLAPQISAFETMQRNANTITAAIQSQLQATSFPRIGSSLDQVFALGGVLRHLEEILQPYHTVLNGFSLPVFPQLGEFEPICNFLLERSWYLTLEAPLDWVLHLSNLLEAGEADEIEAQMAQFIGERLDEIEETLIARFPDRKRFLQAGFNAHRRKEYVLSIPALLAQADGISNELWQQPFFCSRASIAALRDLFAQGAVNPQNDPWLGTMLQLGRLRAHTSSLIPTDDTINRHAVLHGLRTDWDTERNSLKCVALIDFFLSLEWLTSDDQNSDASSVTPA